MKNRLPGWFKQELPDESALGLRQLLSSLGVFTICQEGRCPNLISCFKNKKLTFLILGDVCTRNCQFCAVDKSVPAALAMDESEPQRISRLVDILDLRYVVITSVTRDDLPDGGAQYFAKTIKLIQGLGKEVKVEVLIPDFLAHLQSLKAVVQAHPDVIGHNLETVARLHSELKPRCSYQRSLAVIGMIKKISPRAITKSSLMLGLGENEEELIQAMQDLRRAGCDILTLGQYLAPSLAHYPVKEFISQEQFHRYAHSAVALGFKSVLSGSLVRSSFMAERLYQEFIHA